MKTDETVDFGAELDTLEEKQRAALARARVKAQEALTALRPFKLHEGRILPGLERGVADEVARLEKVAAALESLSTLHLEDTATTPLTAKTGASESVDEDQLARVKAAREEQAA